MTSSPQNPQKNSSSGFGELFDIVFGREDRIFAETSSAVRRLSYTAGEVKQEVLSLAAAICELGITSRFVGIHGKAGLGLIKAFWAVLRSGNLPCIFAPDASDYGFGELDGSFVIDCDGTLVSVHPRAGLSDLVPQSAPREFPEFGSSVALLSASARVYSEEELFASPALSPNAGRKGPWKVISEVSPGTEFWLCGLFLPHCRSGSVFVFPESYNSDTFLRTARKHRATHVYAPASLWNSAEKAALDLAAPRELKKLRSISKLRSPRLARFAADKLLSGVRKKLLGDSVLVCLCLGGALRPSAQRTLKGLGYFLTDSGLELPMPSPEEKTADVPAPESTGDSAVGAILREIMADILAVDESEITENGHFMRDLGGSSLDYFTLLGEINNRFGVTLDFESEKFGYTLRDFERVVTELIS